MRPVRIILYRMKRKRIGILGGTFHPVHNGHILLAEHARTVLSLDTVLFLIDRVPPHKEMSDGASTEERLKMLQLAVENRDGFEVETMELYREGKSYSYDTLRELNTRLPDSDLYFLMGSDMLRSFSTWYNPKGISELCTLVCTERLGQSGGEADTAVSLKALYGTRTILLDSVSDLSSTEVRMHIANALPITDMVPPSVALEIYTHGLYQPEPIRAYYTKLQDHLTEKRLRHTAGVIQTAIELAAHYGADAKKAQIAALLHDCAKYVSEEDLNRMSHDTEKILPVLHSEVGAILASTEYGVSDPEILQAIRLHTTGDANMSLLDKIIYLSDMIEPSRSYPGVELLRCDGDINDRVLKALTHCVNFLEKKGGKIHPATYRAIQYLHHQEE